MPRKDSKTPHEVTETLDKIDLYNFEGEIKDTIKYLKQIEDECTKSGYHKVNIEEEYYWEPYSGQTSAYSRLIIKGVRFETQKEIEVRRKKYFAEKKKEKEDKVLAQEIEKKRYQELKKKYEG